MIPSHEVFGDELNGYLFLFSSSMKFRVTPRLSETLNSWIGSIFSCREGISFRKGGFTRVNMCGYINITDFELIGDGEGGNGLGQ